MGFRMVSLCEGRAEIAYWVVPQFRRRKIATRALNLLTEWAFESSGLHRLELQHSTANEGSCAVALASGFELEGTLRSSVLHADGWHDMQLHAKIHDPSANQFESTAGLIQREAPPHQSAHSTARHRSHPDRAVRRECQLRPPDRLPSPRSGPHGESSTTDGQR